MPSFKFFITFIGLCVAPFVLYGDKKLYEQIFNTEKVKTSERHIQADQYFDAGLLLFKQRDYQKAAEKFSQALRLNPNHHRAQAHLVRVQSVLGSDFSSAQSQAGWLQQNQKVKIQESRVEFEYLFKEAVRSYESINNQDFENESLRLSELYRCEKLFKQCLKGVSALNSKQDKDLYGEKISFYLSKISRDVLEAKSKNEAIKRKAAQVKLTKEANEQSLSLKKKIEKMVRAAQLHLKNKQYEQAIHMSEELLIVDPSNAKIKKLMQKAENLRHQKQKMKTADAQNKALKRRWTEIKDAFIPYVSNVVYPEDWKEINLREQVELKEQEMPEWKKRMERSLNQPLTFKRPDTPLAEVLVQLSDLSGMNIVLSSKVLSEKEEDELEVPNINFENMTLRNILGWILKKLGLSYSLQFNVIYVTLPEGIKDKIYVELYDVQDLLSKKQNFEAPTLREGDYGVSDDGEEIDFGEVEDDVEEDEQEGLNGDALVELVQKIPGDWDNSEAGIILRFIQPGRILVKNTAFVHRQIVDLLKTLRDTSSLQIEVQARLLTVNKNFFRDIGVDWKGLDSTTPLVAAAAGDGEPGFIDNRDEDFDLRGAIINNLAGSDSLNGFFLEHSILSNFQAKVLLRALESNTTTTELISPRIVLVNNVRSYIRLGLTENYISGYTSGGDEGGSGLQPEVSSLDAGQLLSVMATVSSDKKYITMQIQPDFQSVDYRPPATIQGTAVNAGLLGAATQSFTLPVDLPRITKQRIRTTAVIPDSGILILGGVAESHEGERSKGVPILSKIPVFGRLFRSNHKEDSTQDSMFLVHGKIIMFNEIESGL